MRVRSALVTKRETSIDESPIIGIPEILEAAEEETIVCSAHDPKLVHSMSLDQGTKSLN